MTARYYLVGACQLLLLCAACTRTAVRTSEQSVRTDSASTETAAVRQETETTRRVETGPVDVTTTVEEFERPAATVHLPTDGSTQGAPTDTAGSFTARGPAPTLLRRTVTVEHRAPVVATTEQQATVQATSRVETHATVHAEARSRSEVRMRWGPPWWVWLGAGAVAAVGVWLGWRRLRA